MALIYSATDRFWPIREVSLDEKRWTGKRSKAAARNFRAILSACDPLQPVAIRTLQSESTNKTLWVFGAFPLVRNTVWFSTWTAICTTTRVARMSRKALSWMILAGVGLVLFVLMKSSTKDTRENVFEAPPQVSLDDEAPALYTDDIHPVPAGTTPEPPHEDAPAGAATTVEREVPISGLVWTALVPDIDSGGVLTPVSQLYNDLLNESRDEVWASQIEIELKDYLARLPVSSVLEETTIECRQSLCVVAATADSATLSSMGEFNWDSAMFSIADGATGQRIEAKTGTLVVSQDFPHRIGFATIFSRKD